MLSMFDHQSLPISSHMHIAILSAIPLLGTGLLCLFFYLLCYAAVLIKFTYYAQNYAQE